MFIHLITSAYVVLTIVLYWAACVSAPRQRWESWPVHFAVEYVSPLRDRDYFPKLLYWGLPLANAILFGLLPGGVLLLAHYLGFRFHDIHKHSKKDLR